MSSFGKSLFENIRHGFKEFVSAVKSGYKEQDEAIKRKKQQAINEFKALDTAANISISNSIKDTNFSPEEKFTKYEENRRMAFSKSQKTL